MQNTGKNRSRRTAAKPEPPSHDVVILGSGLAGTITAACLARNGVSVLVLDAGQHPRFAIGESTIPYTSMMMRLVSERYGVPEIKYLTTFEAVQSKISTNCGVKRNFGFLYHEPGRSHHPRQSNEFPIPKITHTENHFFRQDVDEWMLKVAQSYGAEVRQRTKVVDIAVDDAGVTLTPEDGPPVRGKFVIDASGFRSPLAEKFALREEPTRLRAHSRSVFTHMTGVRPYEDTVIPRGAHRNPSPWSQGTLHHLFPGGWMWVIPFNNHARATNPLVSVGINLDPRVHPKPEGPPEREFTEFISGYPDIRKQFVNARAARGWVSTNRLQYSSRQTVGYRWCLTSHAAGFIDALFSRGLENTMEIINSLVHRVVDAVRDDDFSVERFEYVQTLEQGLLDFNDDLVANAYTSFQDWDLWDAWFRVWSLAQILATFEINRAYAKYLDNRDMAAIEHLARLEPHGSVPDYAPARELFRTVSETVQQVQNGGLDSASAAERIFKLLGDADFSPPAFGLTDRDNRWYNATTPNVIRTLRWAKREAPPEIGRLVHEGLTLFMRKRLSPDEFDLRGELRHTVAEWPVLGRPFRLPAPR
ncbi:NAD(P)/FAD-dependent oxidoreductase [Actinomadura sp. 9N215]|uniref:NAD(P)/FAD-dependent oxidoreductase n=1 Tax=Actinomadura sp. 9N215 TaxID=3375150 RepID=UPI003788D40C